MKFKVILTRIIEQSTGVVEIEAEAISAAKVEAERLHRVGLEWSNNWVDYGKHEIHGGGKHLMFCFQRHRG